VVSPKNTGKQCPDAGDPTALEAAELYRTLMAALPEAVAITDETGAIQDWNTEATEIFGWAAADVRGRNLVATILPAGSQPFSLAEQAERRDMPSWTRLAARRRDGDNFMAELRVIRTEIDRRPRYLVILRDISDSLLAEQQLVQAQKLEALSHLTGGLAHDFNNILGIIIGSLELIAPAAAAVEERELLRASLAAAKRGAEITRSLLAVARRRAIRPQRSDVNALIGEIEPLLRQSAGRNIEIVFSASALHPVCLIDPGGLNNALVNLVINARDAMPGGGRIIVYTYSTDILPKSLSAPLELKTGNYLVIGVDDNGAGMTPEVAMSAFDPFFTTKERGQGTGLGLAMVYGFARQSGGTARIQSAPGQGTSVQLFLPSISPSSSDSSP
jgi:PAS domain S-box-containing protein